jgi:serine/threonine protein kinase
LSDFGIAVILEATASLAGRDDIGGTPKYLSPEQARVLLGMASESPGAFEVFRDRLRRMLWASKEIPKEPELDGRSDVYSLGVVLFEALAGQVPYQADTLRGTIMAHLTEPVPRIHQIQPGLPGACQEIIDRALAKDPADRFQTAGELAYDVKDLAAGRWFLRQLSE